MRGVSDALLSPLITITHCSGQEKASRATSWQPLRAHREVVPGRPSSQHLPVPRGYTAWPSHQEHICTVDAHISICQTLSSVSADPDTDLVLLTLNTSKNIHGKNKDKE